jgi:hypothetical protein
MEIIKRQVSSKQLMAYQPNITERDLKKIKCPVLIMSGDRDAIRLEHSIKIFNNIENSNFFVRDRGMIPVPHDMNNEITYLNVNKTSSSLIFLSISLINSRLDISSLLSIKKKP